MHRSTEIIDLLYTKNLPVDISMFILSLERQESIINSYKEWSSIKEIYNTNIKHVKCYRHCRYMLLKDIVKIQGDFTKLHIHIKGINELRKDVYDEIGVYFKYRRF